MTPDWPRVIFVCPQCGAIYGTGTDGCWNHGDHTEVSPDPVSVVPTNADSRDEALERLVLAAVPFTDDGVGVAVDHDELQELDEALESARNVLGEHRGTGHHQKDAP